MANYGGFNFNVKRTKPTSFSTPSLVRLDGFRTSATSTKGFEFKPIFKTATKAKGWTDIENVVGKKFPSYAAAIEYVNKLKSGDTGKSGAGFISNLFHDVVDTAVGLGPGLFKLGAGVVKDQYAALPFTDGGFEFKNTRAFGKNIVESYKDTYGPLRHGNFGEFWDNVYNNPLGPILDAATVLTLGAGATVKGAALVAKGSKLAQAAKSEALLARSPEGILKGLKAIDDPKAKVYRYTSKNPVIRARQKMIYKGINSLPRYGARIEEKRFAGRLVKRNTLNTKARMLDADKGKNSPAILGFEKAQRGSGILPRHVTPHMQAAANILAMVGTHMPVERVAANIRRIAKEGGHTPPEDLMKAWEHPEVRKEFEKAVAAFKSGDETRILTYRNMMDQVASVNAVHKGLDVNTVEARKWSMLAHLESDDVTLSYIADEIIQRNPRLDPSTYKNKDKAKAVAALHQAVTDNVLTHLYSQAKTAGMDLADFLDEAIANGDIQAVWGKAYKPVYDIKNALKGKAPLNGAKFEAPATGPGDLNPIYVPHKTAQDAGFGESYGAKGGTLVHANRNIVLTMGRIAIGEDLLGYEFASTLRVRHAMDVRDSLVEASIKVDGADVAQMQASGYVLVKKLDKGKDDFLTKTAQKQINEAFEAMETNPEGVIPALKNIFIENNNPVITGAGKAEKRGGKYLMVKKSTADQLLQEYHASGKIIRNFIERPTNLWKYVVLGLSPRNIVTNVVGNTLMAALFANGPIGAMKIVAHSGLKSLSSEKVTEALTLKGQLGISDRFMQRVFPEHWQASFSHGELNLHGKAHTFAYAYRATHRNEIALRQALFMELLRNNDEVKAFYKQGSPGSEFTRNRWEAAAEKAMTQNPRLRDELSDQVDDALGNYRDFSHKERALRRVIPFYSWFRHAGRTTKALTRRPAVMSGMAAVGREGAATNEAAFGEVPDFMRAFAPLGPVRSETGPDGEPNIMQAAVNTAGLNPFHPIAEFAEAGKILAVDQNVPGATGKVSGFLSPFLTAGVEQLTGQSLLTGAPSPAPLQKGGAIPGFLSRIVAGTPEVRLGAATLKEMNGAPTGMDSLTPTGQLKKTKEPTLSKDLRTQVFNFAGFPFKDVNVTQAQEWQKTLDQKGEFHLPKPRKKKKKKYGLPEFNFTPLGK